MESIHSNKSYENNTFDGMISIDQAVVESQFLDCKFISCDFTQTDFSNCLFEKCLFSGCNFSNTKFTESNFIDCEFKTSKLIGIDWSLLRSSLGLKLTMEKCDLSFCNFASVTISHSCFKKCKMEEIDFTRTVAKEVTFDACNFDKTLFFHTDIRKSDFRGSINYLFNPSDNVCKDAVFDREEALNLLIPFGIKSE